MNERTTDDDSPRPPRAWPAMVMLRPFFIALQFLTRLPVPSLVSVDARDTGRSLLYYPVVGLVTGLLLALVYWTIEGAANVIVAALLLSVWVLITGGLHLDGLADSADAWVGGLGDRERTLAIMKDPRSGPAAVVMLVVVLILKFAALQSLVANGNWMALVLAPVLGRAVMPALFLTTPYVRPGGLGTALAEHIPRRAAALVVLATAVAVLLMAGKQGLGLLVTTAAVFALLRAIMIDRIDGTTGDTAGAMVELIETAALLIAAAW